MKLWLVGAVLAGGCGSALGHQVFHPPVRPAPQPPKHSAPPPVHFAPVHFPPVYVPPPVVRPVPAPPLPRHPTPPAPPPKHQTPPPPKHSVPPKHSTPPPPKHPDPPKHTVSPKHSDPPKHTVSPKHSVPPKHPDKPVPSKHPDPPNHLARPDIIKKGKHREPQAESDAQLRKALGILQSTKKTLERADHDYGGHRVVAIEAIVLAQRQLERALGLPLGGKFFRDGLGGEPQYFSNRQLADSIPVLHKTKEHLEKANHDYHGHRASAVRDLGIAAEQLRIALRYQR